MKKQTVFNQWIGRLLAGLLLLLGFSACDSFEKEPYDMYGSPTTKFSVKGKVVDKESREALPGIRVLLRPDKTYYNYADTLYTDEKGEFTAHPDVREKGSRIIYEDTAHGAFKKDSVEVEFTQIEEGDGRWYMGAYEAEVTIEMEKKKEETPES